MKFKVRVRAVETSEHVRILDAASLEAALAKARAEMDHEHARYSGSWRQQPGTYVAEKILSVEAVR